MYESLGNSWETTETLVIRFRRAIDAPGMRGWGMTTSATMKARLSLYRQLERERKRPLIAYVTSTRGNSGGQISGDAVSEIQAQLHSLPKDAKAVDLLLASVGGDPTVAWRIVSLIRERCETFGVLVPSAAYSAATLIVLGADEIIMHPNGNLGPTDPQITVPKGTKNDEVRFGSEDLSAFLRYVKENVSKNETVVADAFRKFCDDAGTSIAVGVAERGSRLSQSMGEKLLQTHMKGEAKSRAKEIAQKLTKDFFHHGYPVNRSEAEDIGLKIAKRAPAVESLLWRIWTNLSEEMKVREPFNPVELLKGNAACAPLFAAIPTASIPPNLPPEVLQQIVQNIVAQCVVVGVPGTPFENIHAVVESARLASHHITRGEIFASRLPDLTFKISNVVTKQGWETIFPDSK